MDSIGNNMLNGYGGSPFMGGQSLDFPAQQAAGGMPFPGGDSVGSNMYPPNPYGGMGGNASSGGILAGFMNMMQGFMSQIAQMLQSVQGQQGSCAGQTQQGGCAGQAQGMQQQQQPQQQYFHSASLSSAGDPHDAFNGTTGSGQPVSGKWDSMRSHDHLITSDAIPGGFNVATQSTAQQSNGVTYNQSATISANHGNTLVTMGQNGAYSVVDNGQAVPLRSGQTATLSHGETVTLNNNGSLAVGVSNAQGGSINTTLSYNGNGVDVNATANNIALGGYLADKQDGWS
jgi:hypothetical protein